MSRLTGGLSWLLVDMCLGPWRVGPDRNMDGVAVLLEARARGILAPAVIMTGALDVADALNPQALGVIGVLKKPFSMNELVDILAHVAAGATPTKFLFAVIDRPSLNLSRNALHDLGTLPMHQLE